MIIPPTALTVAPGVVPSQQTQTRQPDQAAPLSPSPAQLAFMRSMSGSTTVNYTLDFLKQAATTFTSKKVDEKALSAVTTITGQKAPVSYPDARRLLASWYSLLGSDARAAAGGTLASLAPGIDTARLAASSIPSEGGGGVSPSAEALAEAAKIPTSSVKDALMGLLDAMDPSLYSKAGEVAMKAQLTENIIIEGMPLMSYLISQAKEALQQGS